MGASVARRALEPRATAAGPPRVAFSGSTRDSAASLRTVRVVLPGRLGRCWSRDTATASGERRVDQQVRAGRPAVVGVRLYAGSPADGGHGDALPGSGLMGGGCTSVWPLGERERTLLVRLWTRVVDQAALGALEVAKQRAQVRFVGVEQLR